MFVLYLLIALIAMFLPSHFISLAMYKKLVQNGNRYAMAIRVAVFLVCFGIIAISLVLLVAYNVRFER